MFQFAQPTPSCVQHPLPAWQKKYLRAIVLLLLLFLHHHHHHLLLMILGVRIFPVNKFVLLVKIPTRGTRDTLYSVSLRERTGCCAIACPCFSPFQSQSSREIYLKATPPAIEIDFTLGEIVSGNRFQMDFRVLKRLYDPSNLIDE